MLATLPHIMNTQTTRNSSLSALLRSVVALLVALVLLRAAGRVSYGLPASGLVAASSEPSGGPAVAGSDETNSNSFSQEQAQGASTTPGVVQVSLVSVKNSLGFWRLADLSSLGQEPVQATNMLFDLWSSSSSAPRSPQAAAGSRPSQANKCPSTQSLNYPPAASKLAGKSPVSLSASQSPAAEIVAIEGSSGIKINIVIAVGKPKSPNQADQQSASPGQSRLKLYWSHNNSLITNTNSPKSKFKQELINENDLMMKQRQNFRSAGNDSRSAAGLSRHYFAHHNNYQEHSSDSSSFMLAPYLNEKLPGLMDSINQVKASNHQLLYDTKTVNFLSKSNKQSSVYDDFLAEGLQIDWTKLNSYLRFNELCGGDSNKQEQMQLEQATIVQVELSHLTMTDKGLYELTVCNQQKLDNQCQAISFNLIVLEDYPKLEQKSESKILNVGDRLSIKCEATGFTLPQITWFLDNQQLNEHSSPPTNHASQPHQSLILGNSNMLQLNEQSSQLPMKLRIGDYVTQDNHVHSFINSSFVQLNEAGFYKCQANNGFHSIEHEFRIDVRGLPIIARSMSNLSVLIGTSNLHIQCPYSGYPIHSVEWYFRPAAGSDGATSSAQVDGRHRFADAQQLLSRAKRKSQQRQRLEQLEKQQDQASYLLDYSFLSDPDDNDPDHDDWLSQASAMTPEPNSEDYPDQIPDYPAGQLSSLADADALGQQLWPTDYVQQELPVQRRRRRRRKREAQPEPQRGWIKFPQGRRHQIYLNGTLIVHDVARSDQGFYKCKVFANKQQQPAELQADQSSQQQQREQVEHETSSNEFFLNVLVPPVISPFSSSESLREGMRNFLTCSVIEGDSPISLGWFKDSQPIEEYIQTVASGPPSTGDEATIDSPLLNSQLARQQHSFGIHHQRIRVETSNEYTSTLYFSQVEFRDNGNYTCMATNKASSVNYTAKMLVNVPPKWIRAPRDVECVSGQSIVIDCQAQAHPNPRVWWEIGVYNPAHQQPGPAGAGPLLAAPPGGQQQYSAALQLHPPNHYRTIISNSRIHILENASLVIKDVNKSDQGYYLCQAANNFGSLSSLIKLTVNVGASFSQKYLVKYVKLNDKVDFDCDPIGQSPVDVVWYMRTSNLHHHHQQQQANASSLNQTAAIGVHHNIIDSLMSITSSILSNSHKSQQAAMNMAVGANQAADSLGRQLFSGTIRTELHYQSSPGAINPIKTQTADPELNYIHPSAHQQLQQQQHYANQDPLISFELIKRNDAIRSEFVRLTIKQAKRIHSADFVCQASNKYGRDEKSIKLLVQEPPEPVQNINIIQIESRLVTLNWLPPYNGNSPITSYSVEWSPTTTVAANNSMAPTSNDRNWSQQSVQSASVALSSLLPLTTYEIQIRAHNLFGQSNVSQSMFFTTIEEAPTSPPNDIRAVALSSSSLQLSWLPPNVADAQNRKISSKYSIKGYYLGYKVANSNESYVFKTVVTTFNAIPELSRPFQESNHIFALAEQQPGHRMSMPNGSHSEPQTMDNGQRVKVIVGDLKRSTKYSIIVQAFNSAGSGPQSDIVEVRTLVNDPPPAPLLRVGMVTYNSIEVQWSFQLDSSQTPSDPMMAPSLPIPQASRASSSMFGANSLIMFNDQTKTSSTAEHGAKTNATSLDDNGISSSFSSIDGYYLYYRALNSNTNDWIERKLSPETHTIISWAHQRNDLSIVELSSVANVNEQATNRSGSGAAGSQVMDLSKVSAPIHVGWYANANVLANETNLMKSSRHHESFKSFRFVLDQLNCGTNYQIYLIAYNAIGSGLPSQIIKTKTRGSLPIAPRKQDYLTVNSTYVQLNFDAWMDGGCSVTNFEIRYKQQAGGFLSSQYPRSQGANLVSDKQQWLLLSANISPEQRIIELRDLQPETWYSVLTTAESVAGKTEIPFTFMTLDRFGQLPAEAIAAAAADQQQQQQQASLPALFRAGNGSIKSILYQFSSGNHQYFLSSPMVLSACICLVLIATCSLILIRRYNSLLLKQDHDGASIDSRTTSGAMSSAQLYRHHSNMNRDSLLINQQQQQQQHPGSKPCGANYAQEYYSMKASPCKTTCTTNSTTILTNSSNNSSAMGNQQQLLLDQQPDFQQLNQQDPYQVASELLQYQQLENSGAQQGYGTLNSNQARGEPEFLCSPVCEAAHQMLSPNKFSTLTNSQHQFVGDQQQALGQLNSRFKTMPHGAGSRPVSSFMPSGAYQQARLNCQSSEPYQCQQQLMSEQQQIYSKLRLIYNTGSNYNLCADGQKPASSELTAGNQLMMSELGSANANAINLAVLVQQNPKLMATLKRVSGSADQQQQQHYCRDSAAGLSSLLAECQQQQHQTNDNSALNAGNNFDIQQYQQQSDQQQLQFPMPENQSAGCLVNSQPLLQQQQQQQPASTATSSTSASQLTSDASSDHHLLKLSSSIGGVNNNEFLNTGQAQQQQQTNKQQTTSIKGNNQTAEQSDYALPFPPKWV